MTANGQSRSPLMQAAARMRLLHVRNTALQVELEEAHQRSVEITGELIANVEKLAGIYNEVALHAPAPADAEATH
jgi:hypothetical protein